MKNEISELLSCISKEEFERFGDFIRSPYFNKLPRMVKLYDHLYANYDDLQKGILTREVISKYMYPGENFKNDSIRKLLSDFDKLLENFAVQLEFENSEWDKKVYTLKAYRIRNCDKFEKRLNEYKKDHKDSVQDMGDFYTTNTKLISEEFEFSYLSKFCENDQINQKKSDAFDLEFIAKKLFLFQYMLSREYVDKNLKYSYDFLDEITAFIKKNKKRIIKDEPELYRNFLGTQFMLKDHNEKVLIELNEFIDIKEYYKRKLSGPYWDFINLCTLLTNKGFDNYYSIIFRYVKLMNESGIILSGRFIEHYNFKIIVHSALFEKEFDWLEKFIDLNGQYIKSDFREGMINVSYAYLYYEKKEYEKARLHSEKIKYSDYIHYLSSKNILLKIAYAENNVIELEALNEKIKKYISAHSEIPDFFSQGRAEFAEYIMRLGRLKESIINGENRQYELKKLKEQIIKEKNDIIFKKYLLSTADQLI
ncbi:hypothetical protein BH10BAC5_BH10BAC5_12440 [soil metagenome]